MTMTRLIDAEALKKEVEDLVVGGAEGLKDYYENGSKSDENAWIGGIYDAWELIDNAPTVEINDKSLEIAQKSIELGRKLGRLEGKAERPQGEWKITDAYPHKVYCDRCFKTYAQENWEVWKDGSLPRNFCPNCGADMRGDANGG